MNLVEVGGDEEQGQEEDSGLDALTEDRVEAELLVGDRAECRDREGAHREDDVRPTDKQRHADGILPSTEVTPGQEDDQHGVDRDEQRTHSDHRPVVGIAGRVQRELHGVGVDEHSEHRHGDQAEGDEAPQPALEVPRVKVAECFSDHLPSQAGSG